MRIFPLLKNWLTYFEKDNRYQSLYYFDSTGYIFTYNENQVSG